MRCFSLNAKTGKHDFQDNSKCHLVELYYAMAGYDPGSVAVYTGFPSNGTEYETPESGGSKVLVYILVPLGSVLFVAVVIAAIVFMLKRSRLERLRHHLMPMYNFDATDSGGDWEADLLEEERRQQQVRLRVDDASPPDSPLLKSGGYQSTH
ncbi:hypothetical protein BaRGS_00032744 [Batillaria attramentaria]|uniref:Uncharacterized protein n=1 Tax=Batillaria attramentaria TaxID=370345 RepID=A0ABD0JMA3_9CAEN